MASALSHLPLSIQMKVEYYFSSLAPLGPFGVSQGLTPFFSITMPLWDPDRKTKDALSELAMDQARIKANIVTKT